MRVKRVNWQNTHASSSLTLHYIDRFISQALTLVVHHPASLDLLRGRCSASDLWVHSVLPDVCNMDSLNCGNLITYSTVQTFNLHNVERAPNASTSHYSDYTSMAQE